MTPDGGRGRKRLARGLTALAAAAMAVRTAAAPSTGNGFSAPLTEQVSVLRHRTTSLFDEHDLLDSLHFGWFDRPYQRATLAILSKSMATLDREGELRARGNGAMSEVETGEMIAWAQEAIERVRRPARDDGFRPHRIRVRVGGFAEDTPSAALYAFVDAATATRSHLEFGDVDLLAAMGFRVYARAAGPLQSQPWSDLLHDRVGALGMTLVTVRMEYAPSALRSVATTEAALLVQPTTLERLVAGKFNSAATTEGVVGVLDPAAGEPWACSIARRALARGATGRRPVVVDGWTPPAVTTAGAGDPGRVAAAMWVHALEGQSLGLIRGWRDLRDGSVTPYRSVFTDPRMMEAVALTALDILRLADEIVPFGSSPDLAVAIGPEAVSSGDSNLWASWTQQVWDALLDRQIRFDVISAVADSPQHTERYRTVIRVQGETATILDAFVRELDRACAASLECQPSIEVVELDGQRARDLFVRSVRSAGGDVRVALVNLTAGRRRVRLADGTGLGRLRDLISDEENRSVGSEVALDPWQVCLFRGGR